MGPHQRARESGDAEPDEQYRRDPAQLKVAMGDFAAQVSHRDGAEGHAGDQ
jgi:hypothetical protein